MAGFAYDRDSPFAQRMRTIVDADRLTSCDAAVARVGAEIDALARDLWEHPELSGQEHHAADALCASLESHGFEVERPAVPELPASFIARYWTGSDDWEKGRFGGESDKGRFSDRGEASFDPSRPGPIIGILAEYDALPGLSQAAQPVRQPIVAGGPGHGCGHCLLAAGSVGAALAAAATLDGAGVRAEIRLYGCPAEETLVGKVIMANAGVFDALDLCFSWHPMGFTGVSEHVYAALVSTTFEFQGIAGHAAVSPVEARSATDACELMAVGANYLREHVPSGVMLSYANNAGPLAPNVISDRAESWYFVRAADLAEARLAADRVSDVARGAALMTGTQVREHPVTACQSTLMVPSLNALLGACLEAHPAPEPTPDERAFAESIRATLGEDPTASDREQWAVAEPAGTLLADDSVTLFRTPVPVMGASDYSDVSRRVPTAQVWIAAAPFGTPAHSWQNVACAGSSLGTRAARRAAAVIASGICACASSPEVISLVNEEFASLVSVEGKE